METWKQMKMVSHCLIDWLSLQFPGGFRANWKQGSSETDLNTNSAIILQLTSHNNKKKKQKKINTILNVNEKLKLS